MIPYVYTQHVRAHPRRYNALNFSSQQMTSKGPEGSSENKPHISLSSLKLYWMSALKYTTSFCTALTKAAMKSTQPLCSGNVGAHTDVSAPKRYSYYFCRHIQSRTSMDSLWVTCLRVHCGNYMCPTRPVFGAVPSRHFALNNEFTTGLRQRVRACINSTVSPCILSYL